jgi:hypothetical protein
MFFYRGSILKLNTDELNLNLSKVDSYKFDISDERRKLL